MIQPPASEKKYWETLLIRLVLDDDHALRYRLQDHALPDLVARPA